MDKNEDYEKKSKGQAKIYGLPWSGFGDFHGSKLLPLSHLEKNIVVLLFHRRKNVWSPFFLCQKKCVPLFHQPSPLVLKPGQGTP